MALSPIHAPIPHAQARLTNAELQAKWLRRAIVRIQPS
eukprot:SAG11_NODE_31670_length_290_cov_0.633508_1_plen_37_part_10